ncbi:MAG: outer membrane protein [Actinomycetota bacterium]
MSRLFALSLALTAAALPVLADDQPGCPAPAAPRVDPDRGWYFSGKGGPSFVALSGVKADQGGTPSKDGSHNVVGAFGMAGGYEWAYRYRIPLRTELEFINRTEMTYDASPLLQGGGNSGALASTVQNVTTMAKAYWHFPVKSEAWWPFVSAGLGWSRNTAKSTYTPTGSSVGTKVTNATDDLAWSAGAGVTLKMGPQMMNDIEVRYVDLGSVDWGRSAGQNVHASGVGHFAATEVVFSLRYMF